MGWLGRENWGEEKEGERQKGTERGGINKTERETGNMWRGIEDGWMDR